MSLQPARPLARLLDEAHVQSVLIENGLTPSAARAKAALLARAARRLCEQGTDPQSEARAWHVPGRIEVLGKHTDYAGGASLVAATERGIALVAVPRQDAQARVSDAESGETIQFELAPNLAPAIGHWSNYPMTVARRLARNFPGALRGAEIAFASDLPPASGMSSSSALMIAVYFALAALSDLERHEAYRRNITDGESLACYLASIENGMSFGELAGDRGVGTFGGSEDHIAILCSQPGRLAQYAYAPVRRQRSLALPAGWTFAVLACGIQAQKTGPVRERYNNLSAMARRLAELWAEQNGQPLPHLAAILAAAPENEAALRAAIAQSARPGFPKEALARRLEHFLAENGRIIPGAGEALEADDLAGFGQWVDQSQAASETLLGNQIPETVFLAGAARRLGAAAASAFGAGFGGSVWALIEEERAGAFLAAWQASYRQAYPEPAQAMQAFLTGAGPAAFEL